MANRVTGSSVRISDLNNDTTIKIIGNIHDNNNKKQ